MFIFANVVSGAAEVLSVILSAYFYIVVATVIISWVRPDPYNPVVRFLRQATEPVLYRVRRWLPFTYTKGMDWSPMIVLLIIMFLRTALVASLFELAVSLKTGTMPTLAPELENTRIIE